MVLSSTFHNAACAVVVALFCMQAGGLEAAVRYTVCTSRGLMEDDEVEDDEVVCT
jgi:hypothetical protein